MIDKEKILTRIKTSIKSKNPETKIILFGSRARNDNAENSDWDILLLVDDEKVSNEIEDYYRDFLYDIELDTGHLISIFIYSKSYWKNTLKYSPFYKNINKDGIEL